MKRMGMVLAGVTVAVCPAVIGLWANASFSEAVPVRVPASGQVVRITSTPAPSLSPSPSPSASDDHGGRTPRDERTEPGDDRRHNGPSGAVTSTSGTSGSGTSGSGTSGSTNRHHDDTTVDDHGGDIPRDQRTEAGDDRDTRSDDHGGHGDDSRHGDDSGHGDDD